MKKVKPKNGRKFRQVSIFSLEVSRLNDYLYHPVNRDDPEIINLAESIRVNGLREPLVINEDLYIISGHRRKVACELAGVFNVPCEVLPIPIDSPEFIVMLREYNRQRVKSNDEVIRESILDSNEEIEGMAQSLKVKRKRESEISIESNVEMVTRKKRAGIKGNISLLNAVLKIIDDLRDIWPLSDRKIHYELLNDPPLKHQGKPGSKYKNDRKGRSYQTLTNLLTRARLTGDIPWESIFDETRTVQKWNANQNVGLFVKKQFDGFLNYYWRDLLQSQPNHVEIMGEKNTVKAIIHPIAARFTIPYTIGRGFSSLNPRHDMAERFFKSGKEKLILLILSDFDPEGETICESFATSMRDDFGIVNIHPIKVALTHKQVIEMNLPPGGKAKTKSKNYKRFKSQYGNNVFELEAIKHTVLQKLLTEAIEGVIDIKSFNAEVDKENEEFKELAVWKKKVSSIWAEK